MLWREDMDDEDFGLKICPKCGAVMTPEEEYFDLDHHYEDKWWECHDCGYCMERWN